MEYLALYSKKCKKCGHLDSEEPIKYTNCHHKAGNTECPAIDIQFAIVGAAKRFAIAVKQARAKGDFKREAELLELVSKKTPAFQHKVKEHL